MKKHLSGIREILLSAVRSAGFEVEEGDLQLEKTKTLEHGHFASNVAMLIAGKAGARPRDTAEAIVLKIKDPLITRAEVAGPGFINLFIEQKFYSTELQSLSGDLDKYLKEIVGLRKKKTMVIDYSHPNIAKPMGVHHLLTTVIGDSIKKTYKRLGWKVIADNFIGDMGTQFGKLMVAIKQWGDMAEIERSPIPTLHKLYVQFHMEADKDVELDDEGRAEYKKFEDGDKASRKLWEKIREWSLKEIQVIYDRLNIEFDFMNGESFYEDKMTPILEAGRKQGIIVEGDKGSWIIQPDDPADTPVLLKKSDGTTLYATRDLARIDYWEKTWHPDLMVNVVDTAQEFHFRQLFFASSKLGLTSAQNVHVSFGRMLGMSTCTGNVLLLTDLLDEAETRALALAKEKGESLNEKEQIALSKIMGVGSIKYSILSPARTTNIHFDWNKTLSFEGNSAPYLMYTLARAKSVVRKSGFKAGDIEGFDFTPLIDAETQIALDLIAYPSVLERAADEFKPSHLATYLYQLAQDFNHFYNGNPVIKAETEGLQKSRLLLTSAVVTVMSDGFALLGLEVPEKM